MVLQNQGNICGIEADDIMGASSHTSRTALLDALLLRWQQLELQFGTV